jgi:hypothetical protein
MPQDPSSMVSSPNGRNHYTDAKLPSHHQGWVNR